MWAGAHIGAGTGIWYATEPLPLAARIPTAIAAGVISHWVLDGYPATKVSHWIEEHPRWMQGLIYGSQAALIGWMVWANWPAVAIGTCAGWLSIDCERAWGRNDLHEIPKRFGKVGGVLFETGLTALLALLIWRRR